MKEGDNNTKFFHKMATAKRSVNVIHNLLIGDVRVANEEDIKRYIENFFRHLYLDDRLVRLKVNGLNLLLLGEGQAK